MTTDTKLPADIKELTALRFFAAIWVPCVHVHFFFNSGPASGFGVLAYSWLGVEWFFALSGFILCHVYGGRHPLQYGAFVWSRLSRIYPVHLFTLVLMVVLAAALGSSAPLGAVAGHAVMVQAWGVIKREYLNFPAWSVSAEWFAYLLFPLALYFFEEAMRRPRLIAALTLSATLSMAFAYLHTTHHEFNGETVTWGLVRIIPSFAVGRALYALASKTVLPPVIVERALWACLLLAVVVMLLRPRAWSMLPELWGILFFAALRARAAAPNVLRHPYLQYLGRVSYSIYMTHWPFWSGLLLLGRIFAPHLHRLPHWSVAPAYIAIIPVGAATYHCVEKPARAWMRRHDPFATRTAA